jgi:hypothetical protein
VIFPGTRYQPAFVYIFICYRPLGAGF